MSLVNLRNQMMAAGFALLVAQSAQAGRFGIDGRDGRSGYNGPDGRTPAHSFFAVTDQPISVNLAGENGAPGLSGESGDDAYGCAQPMRVEENLYGASGGNGGQGGRGGDGGNGGDVTLQYTDLSQLSHVLIYAPGGRGAQGGISGRGGRGCVCTFPYWTVRKCHNDPQGHPVCQELGYSCTSGSPGSSPSDGRYGGEGRSGAILLVQNPKQLTQDSPFTTEALGSLFGAGGTVTLSRNLFREVPGISRYLAPGSVVLPNASEFVRQKVVPITFAWSAPQSLASFASNRLGLSLDADGALGIASEDRLWLDSIVSRDIGGTDRAHVEIRAAYRPEEIGNLSFTYIQSSGKSLVAQIDDLNHLPTEVPVRFRLSLETKVLVVWKDRWSGDVPAQLVQKVGGQYQIAVGQLPIDPAWLSGHRTRITVTAEFSMGGQSKSVTVARIASL